MFDIKDIIMRSLKAAAGLILFAFGTYLTVQADIGLAPWDVFSMGLSYHTPLTFGQAAMLISVIFLIIDILLKEKIGIGTILDAFLVGISLDVFEKLEPIKTSENLVWSLVLMTAGMFIMAYSQYLYMSAGLCCGPRDSFLVGIGKRLRKIPIGVVNIGIMAVVLTIGFILGGPVGVGTVYSVAGIGTVMQIVFNALHFEPRETSHLSIIDMIKQKQV